jgi:uncharacterized protein (TIGR03382 family)
VTPAGVPVPAGGSSGKSTSRDPDGDDPDARSVANSGCASTPGTSSAPGYLAAFALCTVSILAARRRRR